MQDSQEKNDHNNHAKERSTIDRIDPYKTGTRSDLACRIPHSTGEKEDSEEGTTNYSYNEHNALVRGNGPLPTYVVKCVFTRVFSTYEQP